MLYYDLVATGNVDESLKLSSEMFPQVSWVVKCLQEPHAGSLATQHLNNHGITMSWMAENLHRGV